MTANPRQFAPRCHRTVDSVYGPFWAADARMSLTTLRYPSSGPITSFERFKLESMATSADLKPTYCSLVRAVGDDGAGDDGVFR